MKKSLNRVRPGESWTTVSTHLSELIPGLDPGSPHSSQILALTSGARVERSSAVWHFQSLAHVSSAGGRSTTYACFRCRGHISGKHRGWAGVLGDPGTMPCSRVQVSLESDLRWWGQTKERLCVCVCVCSAFSVMLTRLFSDF